MKKILFVLFLLPLSLLAQVHLDKSVEFKSFRPIGEQRQWTFIQKDSAIGTLQSKVVDEININGVSGYRINQKLELDYSKIGIDRKIIVKGDFFVSTDGFYLGDKKSILFNEQNEQFELSLNSKKLEGYFTRSGNEVEVVKDNFDNIFAFDNNFIDQLEIILSFSDLIVGKNIEFEYFEPQTQLESNFRGVVEKFSYKKLHTRLADSVYTINVSQPLPMTIYFSKQKKIQKIDIPSQKMKIYLDYVYDEKKIQKQQPTAPQFTIKTLLRLIPNYFLSIVFGLIGISLYIGGNYKNKQLYLIFGIGIIAFIINSFIQYPLQSSLTDRFILPAIRNGESIFLVSIIPVLTTGFVQEIIKFIAIFSVSRFFNIKANLLIIVGVVLGVAFGVSESIYLDSIIGRSQFSWNLFERAFIILYHAASGGLIGYAIINLSKRIFIVLIPLIAINSFFKYLPLFVQTQKADMELMYILLSSVSLIVVFIALILSKKK